jgi:hypothetical protein
MTGGFGNWIRVFGRHHTRNHWTRIWNGSEWLAGHQAIDYLLACGGDPVTCIPAEAAPVEKPQHQPQRRSYAVADGDRLTRRICGYLSRLPSCLGVGQQRHCYAYRFACYLVRDLQLSDDTALHWLTEWDRGNREPLGESELNKQIHCAHLYGRF